MKYEGKYIFNVEINEKDEERIQWDIYRIENMLTDTFTRKEVEGVDIILSILESDIEANEEDISQIKTVEYSKVNANTGFTNIATMDVDIEEVDKGKEYNVKLTNPQAHQKMD